MRLFLAIFAAAWFLLGNTGGGCGWKWSADPLIYVAGAGPCSGGAELHTWDGEFPSLVATSLQEGDCVAGFDRDRWADFFLSCPSTGKTTDLLSKVELGAANAERRAQCKRRVEVGS